jgi:hypothetical protein
MHQKTWGKSLVKNHPKDWPNMGIRRQYPISSGEEYIINDEKLQNTPTLRRRIKHKTNDQRIRAFYIPHPERWHDHHEELTGDEIPF